MKPNQLQLMESGHVKGNYKVWGKPRLEFFFVENKDKKEANHPDFIVQAKDPCGDVVDIGSGFKNKLKEGERVGQDYYSILMNEPMLFKNPMKLVAWPSGNGFFDLRVDNGLKKSGDVEQGQAAEAA